MKRPCFYCKVVFVGITALMLLFGIASADNPYNYKKEYKMTINVGPDVYWGMGATKFVELVREKTNGQINVKPYFNSALLEGAQLKSSQMVAKGDIDCAYESTINSAPVIPQMNIFSLPFFINSLEKLDKIEYGETGKLIFDAMDKKGLVGLAWAENGFRQITNNKKEILSPDDLHGLRVRVVGSPLFIDIFRHFGANPVTMNWEDAQTAFQQGTVDGQENPVGVLIPVKIWQYHKFASFWNYLVDPVIIYWNKTQWDTFPDDIKKAVREAAVESARFEKALCRAGLDGDKSINILKREYNYTMEIPDPVGYLEEKGVKVSFITDDNLHAFIEAAKPLYDKWIPKIGEEIYEKAKADMAK